MTEEQLAHFEGNLDRIKSNASIRREQLAQASQDGLHQKKLLTAVAGIASLVSAGTATVALSRFVSSDILALISVFLSILSGSLSLYISVYYKDEDTVSQLEGASKYLRLREELSVISTDNLTSKDAQKLLKELAARYAELHDKYSKHFPRRNLKVAPSSAIDQPSSTSMFRGTPARGDGKPIRVLGFSRPLLAAASTLLWETTGTIYGRRSNGKSDATQADDDEPTRFISRWPESERAVIEQPLKHSPSKPENA